VFAIVQSSVIEGEQRRQLLVIRRQLQALEDGNVEMRAIDVQPAAWPGFCGSTAM